jgi:hypothetical protein
MKRFLSIAAWLFLSAGFALAQQTFYFPQIADGRDPGSLTHWHTTIFLSNDGSAPANGTVTFFQSHGTPMNISFVDDKSQGAAVANKITFQIQPGQTRKYTSVASADLQVGYGVVTSSVSIAGNAMFAHWTNPPGERLIAEAGVPGAVLMNKQAVFVDTQFGYNSGVAIANPGPTGAAVTFELAGIDGTVVATTTETLPPGQHAARFVTELFGGLTALAGQLRISSDTGLAVVSLRFDASFEKFTTMFPFSVP